MLGELNDATAALEADNDTRFVVLTGQGRAFSGGVDLKALGERELVNGKVGDILDIPARELTGRLSSMSKGDHCQSQWVLLYRCLGDRYGV